MTEMAAKIMNKSKMTLKTKYFLFLGGQIVT